MAFLKCESPVKTGIAGALLALAGAWALYLAWYWNAWMWSAPYPLDFDGFCYLQQFKSYRLTGSGYYFASTALHLYAVAGRLFGLTDAQTYYLLVSSAQLLLAAALAAIASRNGRPLHGALVALWLLGSKLFFLDTFSHPRQTLGIGLVAAGIAIFNPRSPWSVFRNVFAAGLFLAGAGVHILAAFLAATVAAGLVPLKLRPLLKFIPCLWAGLAIVFLINSPKSPGAEWGPQLKSLPDLLDSLLRYSEPSWLEFNFLTYFVPIIAVLAILEGRFKRIAPVLLLFMAMALPLWREDRTFAPRLLSSSIWIAIFILAYAPSATRQRRFPEILSFAGLLCVITFKAFDLRPPRVLGPRFAPVQLEQNAEILKRWIPQNGYVRAPTGVQFRVTYFLDRISGQQWRQSGNSTANFDLTPVSAGTSECIRVSTLQSDRLADIMCIDLEQGWEIRRITSVPQSAAAAPPAAADTP